MNGLTLLTGATGFVGKALLRGLLAQGQDPATLRCLVRRPDGLAEFGLPADSIVTGDLADASALKRAAHGVTTCFHVAGVVKALTFADYLVSNAQGTANLVAALEAESANARLVHVSSLAAAGPSTDGSTSALPPDRCRPPSNYGESKRRGELAVVAAKTLRWIIVRPPVVYGPDDQGSQFLWRQAIAPLCAVPRPARPLSVISVHDVVRALDGDFSNAPDLVAYPRDKADVARILN